jgi:hypothetical protein
MSGIRKPSSIARQSNVPLLGRSRLMSFYQRRATRLAPVLPRPALAAFLPHQSWRWISSYTQQMLRPRYGPYPAYADTGESGIYALRSAVGQGPVRISIASDWGTGTQEAAQVAESMAAGAPDYTIHLGDIYYVGDDTEVRENFLGTLVNRYTPVAWPKGAVGLSRCPAIMRCMAAAAHILRQCWTTARQVTEVRRRRATSVWSRSTGGFLASIRLTTRWGCRCWDGFRV